ncbi:hypothetical protein BWI96_10000 [Siphonobacter sp. SORGH_AS_0500]|nr:NAD(P)H-dependent oxidoreductase [Siphonobacter sp. SORGH_AS_0500]PKK36704.1 hypothetical protein BWI96_10000 [Siphonobacter sp. SORGH_AS_0500]
MKIFVINGGQHFAHSGGKFNSTLVELDKTFFTPEQGFELQITDINEDYDLLEEVQKYVWADVIIYHFPVWWFSMPYRLKEYVDKVFTAGHRKGMFYSDGRKADNPNINYGTGGTMQGRKYLVTTTWNAPETAFTLPGEFFNQTSVDDGVLFGFHRMNAFLSLERMEGIHFHDLEKNVTQERVDSYQERYHNHLKSIFHPDDKSDDQVYITAIVRGRPEYRSQLKDILGNLVQESRKEVSCLRYDLHTTVDDPDTFTFYEIWNDAKGLEEHNHQPHVKAFAAIIDTMLVEQPIILLTKK